MTQKPEDPGESPIVTRRNLLQAGAAAAASLPAGKASAAQPLSPVMAALSAYMSAARERALPDAVVEKTKHHVLDTFAAMISGADLIPGRAAIAFAKSHGGKHVATVVGSDLLAGPIDAALANGVLAHADETDDSHAPSLSHPGCAVVPAALAAGEEAQHRRHAFPARGRARLRHRPARHHVPRRAGALARAASEHPQHRRRVRRGGGRRLRGLARRPADALAARLHRPAVRRHRRLAARQRARREGVRVRRHAGAQRRHLGAAGARRLDRHRRHLLGAGQLFPAPTRRATTSPCSPTSSASATRSSAPTSRSGRSARRSRRRSTQSRFCRSAGRSRPTRFAR